MLYAIAMGQITRHHAHHNTGHLTTTNVLVDCRAFSLCDKKKDYSTSREAQTNSSYSMETRPINTETITCKITE